MAAAFAGVQCGTALDRVLSCSGSAAAEQGFPQWRGECDGHGELVEGNEQRQQSFHAAGDSAQAPAAAGGSMALTAAGSDVRMHAGAGDVQVQLQQLSVAANGKSPQLRAVGKTMKDAELEAAVARVLQVEQVMVSDGASSEGESSGQGG